VIDYLTNSEWYGLLAPGTFTVATLPAAGGESSPSHIKGGVRNIRSSSCPLVVHGQQHSFARTRDYFILLFINHIIKRHR